MKESVLQSLIDGEIYRQAAKRAGFSVTDKLIDDYIKDIADRNGVTVSEIKKGFEEGGISVGALRSWVAYSIVRSAVHSFFSDQISVSDFEIQEKKKIITQENKQCRFYLFEIFFRIDKKQPREKAIRRAKVAIDLVDSGFPFHVVAEVMSQGSYSRSVGDRGWVCEKSLSEKERKEISKLLIGGRSQIIETRFGLKILYLADRAQFGERGSENTKYRCIHAKISFGGTLFTSSDVENRNSMMREIVEMDDVNKVRKRLASSGIEIEEFEVDHSNQYLFHIMRDSKKHPVIMKGSDDQNEMELFMVVEKITQDTKEMSDEEIKKLLSNEKFMKTLNKQCKRMRSTALVDINDANFVKLSD